MKNIIAKNLRGGGKTLSYLLAVVVAIAALQSIAADWTDKDDSTVTYTALKSIKGNGSAYIMTDITPEYTYTVRTKVKLTATGNQCIYCARDSNAKYSFSGFLVNQKFRIDRNGTDNQVSAKANANTTDEYSLEADYGSGTFLINGESQSSIGTGTYTVKGPMSLFASHKGGRSFDNKGSYFLYYFQLWDSQRKLKHNFIPAKKEDATGATTIGLYDTVKNKFYSQSAFTYLEYADFDRAGKKWTGAGDGVSMSDDDNWEGGVAPQEGDDIDFTIAAPNAAIVADIDATFGKIYLGAGDLPAFSGTLTATAISDLKRMQAYDNATEGFTFTLAAPIGQNFAWNGGDAANWWATDVWVYNNASSSWYDRNVAVFNVANATATLNANVTAESVVFSADAKIVTNGTDAATLTVPTVSVAQNVSATIDAPIAGALVKTGAGTLTLKSSRSEATTLSEGTLVFSGNDTTLNWSKFTLGTDPAKPVTLRFEDGAALANMSAELNVGTIANVTSTIWKADGDWTRSGITRIGRAVGANTTFVHEDGTMTFSNYATIGGLVGAQPAKMVVCGGTVNCTKSGSGDVVFNVGPTSDGTLVVTNDATFNVTRSSMLVGNNAGNGTLDVSDGGTVNLADGLYFGWAANSTGSGTVNLRTGGTIVADFVKRNNVVGDLTGAFNFQGGTLKAGAAGTLIEAHDKLTVSVDANGGTIDNGGKNISIAQKITGDGGMTFSGLGTTTISANQEYTGTTTVSEGTTLSVGGGVTFAGSVEFKSDSTLNIANYTAGVTPFAAKSLILPEGEGIVSLTLNGGAFGEGSYVICSASDMTDTNGKKFKFDTEGDLVGKWSVDGNMLILTIGEIDPNAWTGRGGDGKMSTVANWGGGKVPAAGSNIDLSGIAVDTTIIADVNMTFGKVTMGTGVITFTGNFAATSFSDTSKIAVGENSTVTLDGDLVFSNEGGGVHCVCHTIAENGKFVVTGNIVADEANADYVTSCVVAPSASGVIVAKGLLNKSSPTDKYARFVLTRGTSGFHVTWAIGENGISGTKTFQVGNGTRDTSAKFIAETNITISAQLIVSSPLEIVTEGSDGKAYNVTIGGGGSGGINHNGTVTVSGSGTLTANYDVNTLSTMYTTTKANPFTVKSGATLVLKPGANIGTGPLTIGSGAALEIPESDTVMHNGNLSLDTGAALAFNFTDRKNAPVLALADGKAVTFTGEGEIAVKITGDVWPIGGDYVLTACGGFDAEGVTVALADGAPKWAKGIRVNADGNIVLTVRPKSTMIIVR